LFIDKQHQQKFNKDGFIHLKNILKTETVNKLSELYLTINEQQNFEQTDFYINTICFKDTELRKQVINQIYEIVLPTLPGFINTEKTNFPRSGGFCINPANSNVGCRAHQDPTSIDELQSYSMTIWISLIDMTTENGCLHVIPGSHLWGNIHRSLSLKWAFDEYIDYLQSISTPIYTKAGDILCFDNSIIHSSSANKTNQTRLAINIPAIPKGHSMINYYPHKSILSNNKADVYNIDENYFLNESFYERPSEKYPLIKTIQVDNFYTQKNIDQMNRQYNSELQ
jgi:hypothetical protein